jgi:hypothetical protein
VADLHPTKTRLALLRGVRRREVTGYADYAGHVDYYWDGEGKGRKVTGRMEELIVSPAGSGSPGSLAKVTRAGWVMKRSIAVGDQSFPTHSMRLTAVGAAVLEGAGEHRPKEEQEQQR